MFLTATEALQEETNKLMSTNYQLRTGWEGQKLSMVVFKETLISCWQKADCAENQAQNFIVREAKL